MKTCSKCKQTKDLQGFPKDKSRPDGRFPWCSGCNSRNVLKWQKEEPAKANLKNQKFRVDNPGISTVYSARWKAKNPGKARALEAGRRAAKLNATPTWLTPTQLQEIESFYVNRPDGYEVDHIIPLRGKQVSGLHVPWNLQWLTKSENRKKSNKAA